MQQKEEGGSLGVDLRCLQVVGSTDREASLMSLEKQLICPICLEIFSKPVVILPCQHNLCRKCANELYQPSLFQARTTMSVSSGRFRCPACSQEVVLDRHGVYGLQRNLLVENIIDVYKQEVTTNARVSISSTGSPAPLPPPQGQLTCADHEGEKVNIYCLSCQTPTCSLCKVFGGHQDCEVTPLTDHCQRRRDELREGLSSLSSYNNKLQAVMDELEETSRTVQENRRVQEQLVCEKFSHIVSVLQERQKVMTQKISREEEEKTGHAHSLARCYGNRMEENNKLMERARRRLEEPDMAAFIQNSRELITKVLAASTSCSFGTLKEGFVDLNLQTCNFREQEKALRSIDFLKVLLVPPLVAGEPVSSESCEELKDAPIQNLPESIECRDVSNEPLPVEIPPPVEPVKPPVLPPPAPSALLGRSEEETQPASEEQHFNEEVPTGQKEEEPKEEEPKEEEQSEGLPCAAPRVAACEQDDGMSVQQAVTLLLYVLAFLVLLQRVWSYIGCFIFSSS